MISRRPRTPILRFGVRLRWSEKAAGDDGNSSSSPDHPNDCRPVITLWLDSPLCHRLEGCFTQRLQVEAQTDAEGVERFPQADGYAARRRSRAGGGRGTAGAS